MTRLLIAVWLIIISQWVFAADEAHEEESTGWLMPGAVPGTFRFKGSDTSFQIGGRLETHATISDVYFTASQSGRDLLKFAQIPVVAEGENNNQFRLNSRDSRLWLHLMHPIRSQNLDFYLEYDMTENPDSYNFFLRHAYLKVGSLLLGRSFTTFIDSAVLPDVDTGSAPGQIFLKRDQIRWTRLFRDDALELALALEQPDSHISAPNCACIRNYDDDHIPSVASRLTWWADWGQLSISGMLRSLRWQHNEQSLSKTVGGAGLSGRIKLGVVDDLRFMANYGNGLGRFITSGAYADASLARDFSELNPHPVVSMLAAYQHYWSEKWRSTLSLSASQSSLSGSASEQMTKRARSAQVNLFWSPVPDLSIGLEFLHGQRQLLNKQDGELNRLMFSVRYTL